MLHDVGSTLSCAENHVDFAAEVTVVFHYNNYGVSFYINLVTKTIMKNNLQ